MDNKKQANFSIIQMVYGSMVFGVTAFSIYLLYTTKSTIFNYNEKSFFIYLAPAFLVGGFLLSNLLYNRSMANFNNTDSLFQKLTKYQSANIMRGAPLEAAGLMGAVGFLMTSNLVFMILVSIALLIMIINFPSKSKFENAVDLSMEEKQLLSKM